MQKIRKMLSIILVIAVIAVWFLLPSSDLNFPYFYCLGFFLLISALFIYPVQALVARPKTYNSTENRQ